MAIKARRIFDTPSKPSGDDLRNKVEKKAYEIWQKKGCSHGADWSDWFEAEKAVKFGR